MSILTQAEEIINGQRAKDYGDALENHQRIAALWNAYLQKNVVDHNDVAVMMILLKIARFMENGYHQDTVVDIAGYAGVIEKMQLPAEERYAAVPRVWDSLADVPIGVLVECVKSAKEQGDLLKVKVDENGDSHYKWDFQEKWNYWFEAGTLAAADSSYGPFREVLS
ncbi:hypothetical protein SEA_STEAMY_53 [Mycobacterium phage Steamy]|uniref:DUF6378 domain-containing protein n=1 Tax=Mycobacterium phage Steamy TaxID=2250309 RepID=A0A345L0M6_9CAUD|nr:phosphofructokinase [Mycobacterium phage Steamy]AXH48828.1 hypothetical protein SEA_STEAMY_53 [Mycobacterium phage Steamy]